MYFINVRNGKQMPNVRQIRYDTIRYSTFYVRQKVTWVCDLVCRTEPKKTEKVMKRTN